MIRCFPVFFVLLLPAAAHAQTINERIEAFCKKHVDQQVGDGECYALAAKAVEAAGGKQQPAFKDNPGKDDYVWGKLIASHEMTAKGAKKSGKTNDVKPGDIIQYRDTKWKGNYTYSHHTAVVRGVNDDGTKIDIYHQNVNGKREVITDAIDLSGLEAGWIRIYRAQKK